MVLSLASTHSQKEKEKEKLQISPKTLDNFFRQKKKQTLQKKKKIEKPHLQMERNKVMEKGIKKNEKVKSFSRF